MQLADGRQLQHHADERAPTAGLELEQAERSRLIAEFAGAEPELARQLGIET